MHDGRNRTSHPDRPNYALPVRAIASSGLTAPCSPDAASLGPLGRVGVTGSTADRVRDALTEAILSGSFDPGSHLNADTLARQLGVSHIPVREALRSLQSEGWVDMRPHAGAFVRSRSEHELADLFELRLFLEAHAAALAAERRTGEQLDRLDAIVETQARESRPIELAWINEQFHNAVADCSHNTMLCDTILRLGKRARFYFLTAVPGRSAESLVEHRKLTDAIRHRDAATAEDIARAHIDDTRRDVLRAISTGGPTRTS